MKYEVEVVAKATIIVEADDEINAELIAESLSKEQFTVTDIVETNRVRLIGV